MRQRTFLWLAGIGLLLGRVPEAQAVNACGALAQTVCCGASEEAANFDHVPLCPNLSGCRPVQAKNSWGQKLTCCGKDYKALVCLSCTVYMCDVPILHLCRAASYVIKGEGQLAARCLEVAQQDRQTSPVVAGNNDDLLHEDLSTAQLQQN